jgi:hypothetical protein
MYFQAVVAIYAVLLLPLASAKCYKDSPKNTNKQFAYDNIGNSATSLQGELDAGQVRGVCVTDSTQGNHWYFSIRNTGKNGQNVNKEDIDQYLRLEIDGCKENGGYSAHGYIEYKYVCPKTFIAILVVLGLIDYHVALIQTAEFVRIPNTLLTTSQRQNFLIDEALY